MIYFYKLIALNILNLSISKFVILFLKSCSLFLFTFLQFVKRICVCFNQYCFVRKHQIEVLLKKTLNDIFIVFFMIIKKLIIE